MTLSGWRKGLPLVATILTGTGCGGVTPVPPPPIVAEGRISVRQTFSVDLDTGTEANCFDQVADIFFEAVNDTDRLLSPCNNSQLGKVSMMAPGYGVCSDGPMPIESIDFEDLPIGSFLCVRTNANRISQVQVVDLVQCPACPGPSTLEIEFRTWGQP